MAITSYDELVRHVVPGPRSAAYFLPFILLPASLLTPRSVLTRRQNIAIFMPAITLSCIQAWRDMDGVDVISVNSLLWSLFMIALQDPWRDFRWVMASQRDPTNKDDSTENGQAYPIDLKSRLLWVGRLLASIRLDYWKIGHPSHDKRQPPLPGFSSRRAFLWHSVLSFALGYVVLDLTRNYIETDAYFTDMSVAITSTLPFVRSGPAVSQVFRSMVIGAQAWALIGQMFYLPAALPVLLNAVGLVPDKASPHNWPPYFGQAQTILLNGVRGFWGGFWHQTMRWTTTGPGYAIADGLGLSHKSLLRYGILSVSAFVLSGIVHMGLVPPEPRSATIPVNTIRLYMAGFFWSQAVAIILEAVVSRFVKASTATDWSRGSPLLARKVVNSVWLVTWFSLCIPLLGEAARQLGYWRIWPLPISILKGLSGEGYSTWY